jgi:tRNA A-37 threonylcarbamoyl transferase component Bud32
MALPRFHPREERWYHPMRASMADLEHRHVAPDSLGPAASSPEPEWVPQSASAGDDLIGQTVAERWIVERKLGQGGMGVVYGARHSVIDRRVALKVLRADLARDPQIMARFVQEAKAASRIGNPHIVEVSDFGQLPDGSTYFAMELLVGQSLASAIDEHPGKPLPLGRIVHVARQVARGLGAAHDAGIVHRDLKPDNVMLVARGSDADFVKVLDFGIAKVGSSAEKVTRAGQVFGTPHYMSPEQAEGRSVDARTDVYALGVMMFEMASGGVPFDADNFMGILTQHLYKEPPPLKVALDGTPVSPALAAIVGKCMAKKADERYLTMEEVAAELDRLAGGSTPLAAQMAPRGPAGAGRSFAQTAYTPETLTEMPAPGHDGETDSSRSPTVARKPRRVSPVLVGGAAALVVALAAAGWMASRRATAPEPLHADPSPVVATAAAASSTSAPAPGSAVGPPPVASAAPAAPVASIAAVTDPAAAVDAGKPRATPRRPAGPARTKCNIEDPGCDPWK